jgi:C4-dicarboxylate-specific signal transduction histidine kinase
MRARGRLPLRTIPRRRSRGPNRPALPQGPELWVRADAPRLVQVFVNLLVNASQAMPARSRHENRIELRLERRGEQIAICVADNGEGISPAVRARIFDPFFTTKPAGIGTGLGLSVCHGIVSGLGGPHRGRERARSGDVFHRSAPRRAALSRGRR